LVALGSATAFFLLVAIPTALIETPVFGREIPPTWWAAPSLAVSSVLGGLLLATYVDSGPGERSGSNRRGWAGGALTYFAVGCPVCNKIVLLALGSAGAITWFEPVQPVLQLVAIGLLVWALISRLRGEVYCPAPPAASPMMTNADHSTVGDAHHG